jgi:hypothetical protein
MNFPLPHTPSPFYYPAYLSLKTKTVSPTKGIDRRDSNRWRDELCESQTERRHRKIRKDATTIAVGSAAPTNK